MNCAAQNARRWSGCRNRPRERKKGPPRFPETTQPCGLTRKIPATPYPGGAREMRPTHRVRSSSMIRAVAGAGMARPPVCERES
jgi:hypothetical protein